MIELPDFRSQSGQTVAQYFNELGIGSEALFNIELANVLEEMPGRVAVAEIDVGKLGITNNTEGRHAGDALLKTVGFVLQTVTRNEVAVVDDEQRIVPEQASDIISTINAASSSYTPPNSTANRLANGDEFGVILPGMENEADLEAWVQRTRERFSEFSLNVYIGAALHIPGQSPEELVDRADKAMVKDKHDQKARPYDDETRRFILEVGRQLLERGVPLRDLAVLVQALGGISLDTVPKTRI